MTELFEKQFMLGDVVFGLGCAVELKGEGGWVPGQPDRREDRVENPGDDGIRFGRTLKGAATWGFSLYTNQENENAAWSVLNELSRVWDQDDVRLTPGAAVPLQFCLNGQQRVVYGQPGRWTASPNNASMQGRIDIEADFTVVDDRAYSANVQTLEVPLGAPASADAGLIVPFIPPVVSSASTVSNKREIVVEGELPTPVTIKISGDISKPQVAIADWVAAINDDVEPGDPVTIDSRPWVRAITRQSGGGVEVAPRVTRVSKMWLKPGRYNVLFSGDSQGGATALVSWRNAYRVPR